VDPFLDHFLDTLLCFIWGSMASRALLPLLLLAWFCLPCAPRSSASAEGRVFTPREALLELFSSTGGPSSHWKIDTGWRTEDGCHCDWFGVTCSPSLEGTVAMALQQCDNTSLVVRLSLVDNGLTGGLPAADTVWQALASLQYVDLSHNSLGEQGLLDDGSGAAPRVVAGRQSAVGLPASLRWLSQLRTLRVASSGLGGLVPAEIFAGPSKLASLEELVLDDNQLTGAVPSLQELSNLTSVSMANNALSSSLPVLPPSLTFLNLRENRLRSTRDCSSWFAGMDKLRYVILAKNWLSGNLSDCDLFSACSSSTDRAHNLEYVDLSGNEFTGSLPASLPSCVGLNLLDLSGNSLSGTFSMDLQNIWANHPVGMQKQGTTSASCDSVVSLRR
jgi:Leucine rich repeat N-terminal domain/Leucine Rich Repeat